MKPYSLLLLLVSINSFALGEFKVKFGEVSLKAQGEKNINNASFIKEIPSIEIDEFGNKVLPIRESDSIQVSSYKKKFNYGLKIIPPNENEYFVDVVLKLPGTYFLADENLLLSTDVKGEFIYPLPLSDEMVGVHYIYVTINGGETYPIYYYVYDHE